jgi:CheY-like chemotaxis protein
MVPDAERRRRLADVVRSRGLQVAAATEGDMVQILGQEAPDAVVLDMDLPGGHGMASLRELREDRVHTGLPVLVLTNQGMADEDQGIIRELATVHVPGGDGPEALAKMLDVSFPVGLQEVDR